MSEIVSDEVQELEELATREYKYGFVTDIEQDAAPPGSERGYHRLHFHEEERTRLVVAMAA